MMRPISIQVAYSGKQLGLKTCFLTKAHTIAVEEEEVINIGGKS